MIERINVINESEFTPVLKKITFFASGGIFLDGYLLTIIGIALVQLGPALQLDEVWIGLAGAASLFGILVGGLLFGWLTDIVGRKYMYMIDLAAIVILSIWCLFITTPLELVVIRFAIGLAIGADYPISSALITEFTPTRHRGKMLGIAMAAWYVGAVVASVVGYFMLSLTNGGAWMLASAAIPSIILIIGRFDCPESPRWLLKSGKTDKALAVVKKIWGEQAELEDLEEEPKKTKYSLLFKKEYFKRLMFCGLFWMCQVIPCFAIYTFGPQILSAFGMNEGDNWIWGYCLISVCFLLGTLPGLRWVETVGRRPTLIRSFILMTLGLGVFSLFADPPLWLVLVGFAVYAFFSGPPTILDSLYPNELFPTEIRASAVGFATAISRIGSAIGTFALPIMLINIGVQMTMLVATLITLAGLVISVVMAPETRGKTLTETSSLDF